MKIKDTLTRTMREFVPINAGRINLFVCGPTVYNLVHVGNGRAFVVFDAFAKFLRSEGYEVFYLQNITDIDDKIIDRAREENRNWKEIAKEFLACYMDDMRDAGVDSVSHYAPATNYVGEMVVQIRRLIELGSAYETPDGVYYDISSFSDYGKLSGQNLDKIRSGARVEVNEDKRNPSDFVLWKKEKPGEPSWDSPWGRGRPGWHIEDTAITESFLGDEYDIHGGGSDLIFPHHEAEIAQERMISGKQYLSHYWMHSGMLNMGKEKMSKSQGNIVTLRDVISRHGKEAFRYFVLNSMYDSPLSYSEESLNAAGESVSRINEAFRKISGSRGAGKGKSIDSMSYEKRFRERLSNGFDTHGAITEVLNLVAELNRKEGDISAEEKSELMDFFRLVDSIYGIIRKDASHPDDSLIRNILSLRQELRKKGDYSSSDAIRKALLDSGIEIQDKGNETDWWYS
jgi:cysteinyl-tRNA synthetase